MVSPELPRKTYSGTRFGQDEVRQDDSEGDPCREAKRQEEKKKISPHEPTLEISRSCVRISKLS